MEFHVGDQFSSYEELKKKIKEYEDTKFIQLRVSDSRTLKCARERGIRRFMDDKLQYYEIIYKCIHGGVRKSKSTGQRPAQKTFRQNCPFFIKLNVSSDGNFLEVVKMVNDHNHAYSKETYCFLPRQRKLDAPVREFTRQLIKLRANKKLVQADLMPSKKVTLKDLHNLAASKKPEDQATLENVVSYLTQTDSNVVELVRNDDNALLGLFYQDAEMKRVFTCYPEMIFIDAIYKVSDIRAPLYIFAVEDGNGETEIVSFFLAMSEDAVTIRTMVRLFKKHNSAWEKCRSVMTDKDFQERQAFGEEFPNASLLICLFHTFRSFRREITVEKMGITTGERDMLLEIIQKIAYARNEDEYFLKYEELKETQIKSAIEYYNKSWHPIRHQWVIGLQRSVTYGNRTNNRLESLNSKVVQVVQRHSNILDLFKDLDTLLLSLRNERDNTVAQMQLRVPLNISISNEDEEKYFQLLTPFAYKIVAEKFRHKDSVQISGDINSNPVFVISRNVTLSVTPDSCSCSFFTYMELPCRHILKIRELKQLSLFSKSLVSVRWMKTYYIASGRLSLSEQTHEENEFNTCVVNTVATTTKVLTQHEKYRLVSSKVQKIASLASEAPARLFPQRLKVLDTLINFWENNVEATVSSVYDDISSNDMFSSEDTITDEIQAKSNKEYVDNTLQFHHVMFDNDSTEATSNEIMDSMDTDGTLDNINVAKDDVLDIIQYEPVMQSVGTSGMKNVIGPNFLAEHTYCATEDTSTLPHLPPKIKKRGRPKGFDTTAIGLPTKRHKGKKVLSFERKHPKQKEIIMLKWFISTECAQEAVNGHIIDKNSIKDNVNEVSSACIDSRVHISRLRKYFTEEAWSLIQQIVQVKKTKPLFLCSSCSQVSCERSIFCNSCLECYHLRCAGLKVRPRRTNWFCRQCHSSV